MSSIFDVARRAKVSPSTVSLVVNRSARVSPDTRDRVTSAISQLGYVPRPYRRRQDEAPASREPTATANHAMPRHIAIVYTQDAVRNGGLTTLCHEWIQGVRKVIAPLGDHVTVLGGHDHVDRDLIFQENLRAGDVQGVVIFGLRSANGYLDALLNAGIPTVTLNHPPRGTEHGCVSVDYAGGGRLAAQALLDAGHEKVFVLKSQASNEWTSLAAAEGFSQVFKRAGKSRILTLSDMDGVKDIGDVAALAKAIRKQVTAVFCGDYYAVQILNALENLGVRVPDDIAVMGFDDTAQVSGNGLKLTSIGFDKQKMGRLAAKLLMQMMPPNPSLHSGSLVVPTFLVQGDTTRSA